MPYAIQIKGQLDTTWSDWFDGVEMHHLEDGTTLLQGPFCDQSALIAALNRLHNLNVTVLSVQPLQPTQDQSDKDTNL